MRDRSPAVELDEVEIRALLEKLIGREGELNMPSTIPGQLDLLEGEWRRTRGQWRLARDAEGRPSLVLDLGRVNNFEALASEAKAAAAEWNMAWTVHASEAARRREGASLAHLAIRFGISLRTLQTWRRALLPAPPEPPQRAEKTRSPHLRLVPDRSEDRKDRTAGRGQVMQPADRAAVRH
jgi:hypothetical protein